MSRGGRNLAKTLRANGFSPPGTAVMGTGRFRKHGKVGDFVLDEIELRKFSKNIDAYIKTLSGENIKTVLQVNANAIIVPKVRQAIRGKSTQTKNHFYYRDGKRTEVVPDNLAKSYQVLWPNRKKIKSSAFVGPKLKTKGAQLAKTIGRTEKTSWGVYGSAWEGRYGKIIKQTVKGTAPMFLLANARMIKAMMKP